MDVKKLFLICLESATDVVKQVKVSQFDDPTPDTEWNVRQLASHILYELAWVPDILSGRTITEVGGKYDGDLIGNNLQNSWSEREKLAKEAVYKVDVNSIIHLSYGNFPAKHYLQQAANDQLIHSWDLGRAIKIPVFFDKEVLLELYKKALPRKNQLVKSGLFAPVIDVSNNSDLQTKFLAIYGRDAR
jgi:uncharacterized protein (TIGR03086 family)